MKFKKMKCEHKDCNKEAEINICHNHINVDYPPEISRDEVLKIIDECEIFEIRQDLEKEGVEYPLIDKEELKSKISEVGK